VLQKLQNFAVTKSALWLSLMNVITLKLTAIIVFRKQRQKLKLVNFKALYNAKEKKWGRSLVIFVMMAGRLGAEGWTEGGRKFNLLKL
jgi:hypothetical protein